MMKRLHRNRSDGAQRHDGAESGPPPPRRNDHNRSFLDHLRGLKTGEVAHQQSAGMWMEWQIGQGQIALARPVRSTRRGVASSTMVDSEVVHAECLDLTSRFLR